MSIREEQTAREQMIAELKVQLDFAVDIEEWESINNHIKELEEMQYEDEDGKLQWL
jgi:hypothetical protein